MVAKSYQPPPLGSVRVQRHGLAVRRFAVRRFAVRVQRHGFARHTRLTMALAEFKLQHSLRVRWAEVDPQNIVFNPHYLMYFDVAITEYWRAIGLSYPTGFSQYGADTVVVKATLEYKAPARFDDELIVAVRCARIGRTSLRMLAEIARDGATLTEVEVVYVIVTEDGHQPMPVPQALVAAIKAYELQAPQ
ncbi:MAG: thioesterase family protein [Myxococcales bacterium]|nr:thioesterase family protein [Myxococcales bacterium]